jgi:hypothetical protein
MSSPPPIAPGVVAGGRAVGCAGAWQRPASGVAASRNWWRRSASGVAARHGWRLAAGGGTCVDMELGIREAERERLTVLVDWGFGELNWALVGHLG